MEDLTKAKKDLLNAFQETTSTYHIDVLDNSMLPEALKQKEKISFVVKPPTIRILTKAGLVLADLPEELVFSEKQIDFREAIKYANSMVKIFCIISHGKETNYPDWYESFIMNNVTPKELYLLFQEVVLKAQIGFFLHSFKIQGMMNPMMIPKETKTP